MYTSLGAFKVTTNGGIKLYINNEEKPYISNWKNKTSTSFTTSYVATGSSQPISLELQFNNYQNIHNLKLEWRKTGSTTWQDVDSSFYQDSSVSPILIDSNKIEKLSYLVVGKTLDEINKIEELAQNQIPDYLDNARDWLLISCYCGQRISDFMRFDKSMIRYEKNKQGILKPFIEFTQVKTNKLMTVALHPKVIEILEKRNDEFPKPISDAKYNLYIKQVCRIAEITDV